MPPVNEGNFQDMLDALKGLRSAGSFLNDEDMKKLDKFFDIFKDRIDEATKDLEKYSATAKNIANDVAEFYKGIGEEHNRFKKEIKEIERVGRDGSTQEAVTALDDLIKKIEALGDSATESEEGLKKLLISDKEMLDAQAKLLNFKGREIKEQKMLNNILESNMTKVDNFFGAMGIKNMGQEKNISPLYAGLKQLMDKDGEGPNQLMAGLQVKLLGIKNFLSPLNLAVNAIETFKMKTFELTKVLDEQLGAFEKQTGIIGTYNDQIEDSFQNTRFFGLSLEDVKNQMVANVQGIRAFSEQSKTTQTQITSFGAAVTRLGGSAEQTSKIFSFFMDSLNQGSKQAEGSYSRLLGISKATGLTLGQVQKDFIQALPEIAKFGSQAVNVFAQMAGTAKALKLETSDLLNIAKGFDTFETAAGSVGRLNAILGGPYLNAIQLMNQTEGEKIQTLNAAFKATGKNWKALEKYERQTIATAAGITDMDVANRLFSGSLSDVGKFTREQTIRQEELNERNRNASTLAEKWASFMSSISVILSPMLDVLHFVADALLKLANLFDGKFGIALMGLIGGLITLRLLFKGFDFIKNLTSWFMGFGKAAAIAGTGIGGFGDKVDKVASPGMGARIMGFFKGIGTAISSFADSIVKAGPKILGMVAIIGAGYTVFKLFQGIGDALGDLFSDSPLEEFQDEMEDLTESINGTGFDFSAKIASLQALFDATKELSKVNVGQALEQLEKFVVSTAKINPKVMADNSQIINNLIDANSKVSAASITTTQNPTTNEILALLKKQSNQKIELIINLDGKQIGKSAFEFIDGKCNMRAG